MTNCCLIAGRPNRRLEHRAVVRRDRRTLTKSLREFNAWSLDAKDPQQSFRTNANETLRKHPELRKDVEALFELVLQSRRPKVRPRDASVQRARDQVKVHLAIRQIAEREVLRLQQENADLRGTVSGLRGQINSMAEEAGRVREDLESEIEVIRKQHADVLKALPKNVRPIRGG